jgi:hypothetical protein
MVVSCHACYLFLSLIKVLTDSKVDVCLSLELVQMAAGETPERRNERRAWDMTAVVADLLFRQLFFSRERKRFSPKPVSMDPVPPMSPADARRLRFFGRILHGGLVQNRPARTLLGAAVKASIRRYRGFLSRKKRRAPGMGAVQT